MSIFVIGQFILIIIQLIVIGIYTEKREVLSEDQAKDYRRASWACCGGVWILFFLSLIF